MPPLQFDQSEGLDQLPLVVAEQVSPAAFARQVVSVNADAINKPTSMNAARVTIVLCVPHQRIWSLLFSSSFVMSLIRMI